MTKAIPGGSDAVRAVIVSSKERRFLLTPLAVSVRGGSVWTVPTILMRPGETSRRAAVRYLRRDLRLPTVRIMPLIGRLRASGESMGAEYVVLAAPAFGEWPARVGSALGPAGRWWTTASLRKERAIVEPMQLLDFMDGYWEGWLPDGEISLE